MPFQEEKVHPRPDVISPESEVPLGSKVQTEDSIVSKMGLEQTVLNGLSSTVTNTLSRKNTNLCYNLDLLNDDVTFSRIGQFLTYLAKVQPSPYLQFSSRG